MSGMITINTGVKDLTEELLGLEVGDLYHCANQRAALLHPLPSHLVGRAVVHVHLLALKIRYQIF